MNRKYEIITSILVVIVIIGALIFAGKRGVLKEHSNLIGITKKIIMMTNLLKNLFQVME